MSSRRECAADGLFLGPGSGLIVVRFEMSLKSWDTMSIAEKLDALRRDMQIIFDEANSINSKIDERDRAISELFQRLEQLEKKAG